MIFVRLALTSVRKNRHFFRYKVKKINSMFFILCRLMKVLIILEKNSDSSNQEQHKTALILIIIYSSSLNFFPKTTKLPEFPVCRGQPRHI